jgi:flagellar basal-body rod modification protein FlgD
MQIDPVASVGTPSAAAGASPVQESATSAFGLGFDALLKIILTQLTYQDPLKPMDNFQFVSQLGQFSQIQQGQTMNDRLSVLISAQGTLQATGLLGRTVDIPAGTAVLSGKVVSVAFQDGAARLTIKTGDNQTISNIAITSVSQIREGS